MSDEDLIFIASEFRAGLLDGQSSEMMCAAICWPLAGLLRMHNVDCECIESDLGHCNHVWLRLKDGRALDPTADQFNRLFVLNHPAIYLGKPLEIHSL